MTTTLATRAASGEIGPQGYQQVYCPDPPYGCESATRQYDFTNQLCHCAIPQTGL